MGIVTRSFGTGCRSILNGSYHTADNAPLVPSHATYCRHSDASFSCSAAVLDSSPRCTTQIRHPLNLRRSRSYLYLSANQAPNPTLANSPPSNSVSQHAPCWSNLDSDGALRRRRLYRLGSSASVHRQESLPQSPRSIVRWMARRQVNIWLAVSSVLRPIILHRRSSSVIRTSSMEIQRGSHAAVWSSCCGPWNVRGTQCTI